MREPKVYEDLTDLGVLKAAMETALKEYNLSPAVVPMQLVLFREAIEHSEPPRLRPHPGIPMASCAPARLGTCLPFWPNSFCLRVVPYRRGGCSKWRGCLGTRPPPTHTPGSLDFSCRHPCL